MGHTLQILHAVYQLNKIDRAQKWSIVVYCFNEIFYFFIADKSYVELDRR